MPISAEVSGGLKKKIGPLPVWGWGVAILGGIGVLLILRRGKSSSGDAGGQLGQGTFPIVDLGAGGSGGTSPDPGSGSGTVPTPTPVIPPTPTPTPTTGPDWYQWWLDWVAAHPGVPTPPTPGSGGGNPSPNPTPTPTPTVPAPQTGVPGLGGWLSGIGGLQGPPHIPGVLGSGQTYSEGIAELQAAGLPGILMSPRNYALGADSNNPQQVTAIGHVMNISPSAAQQFITDVQYEQNVLVPAYAAGNIVGNVTDPVTGYVSIASIENALASGQATGTNPTAPIPPTVLHGGGGTQAAPAAQAHIDHYESGTPVWSDGRHGY